MTDAAALLEAIRAAPDDDAPRLIYADWLDEHGQSERAEFIRVQCEVARRECPNLRRREGELLAAHHDAFAGPLAAPELRFRFHRGFAVGFGHTGVFAGKHGSMTCLLRFFPDGWVLTMTASRPPEEVTGHFRRSNKYCSRGSYEFDAFHFPPQVRFSCDSIARDRRFDFSHVRELEFSGVLDGLKLYPDAHCRINGYPMRRRFLHHDIEGVDSFTET